MNIDVFCLGDLDTNAYVVSDGSGNCWIFDCPGNPKKLISHINKQNWTPQGLFLTHAHVDHMAGLTELRRAFESVEVWQHPLETSWLSDPRANLSALMGLSVTAEPAENLVSEGQRIALGPYEAEVLHVPGHSPGSVAFWFAAEMEVISGDVLFRSGVGRWDFPGCDRDDLRASLERLCNLPPETRVRPGHGGSTTIGREKTHNPYLRDPGVWD